MNNLDNTFKELFFSTKAMPEIVDYLKGMATGGDKYLRITELLESTPHGVLLKRRLATDEARAYALVKKAQCLNMIGLPEDYFKRYET